MAMFAAPKKKGFDWGNAFVAAFSPSTYQSMQQREHEEGQYQRRLSDEKQSWIEREMWKRQNPAPRAPTEFERMLEASGLQPGTPQYQQVIRQYVNNRANPFIPMTVQNPDGSETRQFIRPPMGGDDEWEYSDGNSEGGQQGAPLTGGFPGYAPIQRSNGSVYRRF